MKNVSQEEFEQFLTKHPKSSRLLDGKPYIKPSFYYFKNVQDSYGVDWFDRIIAMSRYSESSNSYSYRILENDNGR